MSSWRAIMVHVDDGPAAPERIEVAVRLASTLSATLIGAAGLNMDVRYAGDPMAGALIAGDTSECERKLARLEAAFRKHAADRVPIEWRGEIADPARFLHKHARAADVLVIGRSESKARASSLLEVTPSSVFLASGRPTLIPARGATALHGESVVLAWSDTTEARRAAQAALPLLKRAREVLVLGVGEGVGLADLQDVARHLERHEVTARPEHRAGSEGSVAAQLEDAADRIAADLIVAGGYGHSRAMQWLLGGVTCDLLESSRRHLLLVH